MTTLNKAPGLCKICHVEVPAGAGVVKRHPGAPGRVTHGLWIVLCATHKDVRFTRVVNP